MEKLIGSRYSILGMMALCILAFFPVFSNGFVNFDDPFLILENTIVTSGHWDTIGSVFSFQFGSSDYKPLVFIIYKTIHEWFGLSPFAFHAISLLFHLVAAVYAFSILRNLLSKSNLEFKTQWSFLGALFWAVHPLKVESIAWASELEDTMFGCFYLGAVYVFLRILDSKISPVLGWGLVVLLFLCSFLSKALAVTLPLVLVWVFLFKKEEWSGWRNRFFIGIPVLALLAALVFYAITPDKYATLTADLSGLNEIVSPVFPISNLGATLTAIWVMLLKIVAYASHIVVPFKQSIIFPYDSYLDEHSILLLLSPLLVLITFIWGIWKGNEQTTIYLGLGLYLLMLSPILLIPVTGTNFMSDRYTYLPLFGMVVMVLGVVEMVTPRVREKYALYLTGILILIFVGLSHLRTYTWKNSETLFTQLIQEYPNEEIGYNNLGLYYYNQGDEEKANDYYAKALKLNPNLKEALMNSAVYAFKNDDLDKALKNLNQFIVQYPEDQRGYGARGGVLAKLGKETEAIADLEKAVSMGLFSLDAYRNLGKIYINQGEFQKAADSYQKYLNFYPRDPEMNYLKGVIEERLGNYQESTNYISIAIEEHPENGRYYVSRAKAYFLLGQKENARSDVSKAQSLGVGVSQQFLDLLSE